MSYSDQVTSRIARFLYKHNREDDAEALAKIQEKQTKELSRLRRENVSLRRDLGHRVIEIAKLKEELGT